MKRILLFLFLAVAVTMHAQIVNIPDTVFKSKLLASSQWSEIAKGFDGTYIDIDANNDNEIQVSEAEAVMELQIYTPQPEGMHPQIESLEGIASFSNLRVLTCWGNKLTELDVTALTNLRKLTANDNDLTSLIVDGLINLEELSCGHNMLTTLDISSLINLKTFSCPWNQFETLNVNGFLDLTSLNVSFNPLSSIDVSDLPALETFYCGETSISQIDLGNSSNLRRISTTSCNFLEIISLKNGGVTGEPQYCDFSYCPNLVYICLDEGEESVMEPYLSDTININSYCSSTMGGNYNTIKGSVFFDYENDGCDSEDIVNQIKVRITDGDVTKTSLSNVEMYNFYTKEGNFTVTPNFENDFFTISPASAEITFTEVNSLVSTQNFCIVPNGIHPDLDVIIVSNSPRPGFDSNYRIIYTNKGNQVLSGTIVFNYQENVLDVVSSSPEPLAAASGSITWSYTNLLPFQHQVIYATLNVNSPMETPAVNINDVLTFSASILPSSGDETPEDNIFQLNQIVVSSMDPNDITCLEGNSVNPYRIGEYLHYNINFENTGTAPATFIVVKDVIDTAQFDIASLQLINASHPVQAKVTDNKVEFRFDDINLGPDEKGNVTFKIKTLNTLQANDDVTQQADIFFDYNWPIATNDATTVFEALSRGDFSMDNTVKVYPNPSTGIVNIKAASEIRSAELYDAQGRLLQAGSNVLLDISGRATGIYFVKVFTEKGMKVERIVKN